MSTFIISDTHFFHDKDFIYGPRGFESINEHDCAICENWNASVGNNDDVYLVGDVCLGDDYEKMRAILESLNGKIHIAIGNHDSEGKIAAYKTAKNVVEVAYGYRFVVGDQTVFLSHYPTLTEWGNKDKKKISRMILNIHGHTHSKDKFTEGIPYMYNCCIEAIGTTPLLIEDAIAEIRKNIQESRKIAFAH